MLKKMMLLAISVGALAAFAAPAAQGQLLYEKDVAGKHIALALNAEVTLTSTNLQIHTPKGTLTCTKFTIHGKVSLNGAAASRITGTSTTVEGCNTPITGQTVGLITIGALTGTADTATLKGAGCHYAGNMPVHYVTNSDTLHLTGKEQFTGTPAAECGKGTMTGTLTLETGDGTTVFIT